MLLTDSLWPPDGRPWNILGRHETVQVIINYISPGSQIPQVEARKRCLRDIFTSSGRATALIGRHFWYTILQQSMTRLADTAILLTYISRFHWRFSGNCQEHICECNIRCFGSPSHLSLGSDRLIVSMPNLHCTAVGCTAHSRKLKLLEKYPWMAGVTFIKFPTSLFHRRIWFNLLRPGGPNDRMTAKKHRQMAESLLTAFRWWPPYSAAPAPNIVWLQ